MADMAVEQTGLFQWLLSIVLGPESFRFVSRDQGHLQVLAAQLRRSRWQLLRPQLTSHRSKGELQGSRDHRKKSSLR
jgi:hypothetical protein